MQLQGLAQHRRQVHFIESAQTSDTLKTLFKARFGVRIGVDKENLVAANRA